MNRHQTVDSRPDRLTVAVLTLCSVFLGASASRAQTTLLVPEQFGSIQEAIQNAAHGDVVSVNSGVYHGNLDFLGKAITVKSRTGPETTTIIGSGSGAVAVFRSDEGHGSVLEGFTIENGTGEIPVSGFRSGGGVFIEAATPTIRDNVITRNSAEIGAGIFVRLPCVPIIERNRIEANRATSSTLYTAAGGGIATEDDSSPIVTENVIQGNTAWDGGGVSCYLSSQPVLFGNVIDANSADVAGGISCRSGAKPVIEQNVIRANTGGFGGIAAWRASPVIRRNRIESNLGTSFGGGVLLNEVPSIRIEACTITGNQTYTGGGGIAAFCSGVIVSNCLLSENSAFPSRVFLPSVGSRLDGGSAAYFFDCQEITMVNNTVVRNGGGANAIQIASNANRPVDANWGKLRIINSIVWGNYGFPQVLPGYYDYVGGPGPPFDIRFIHIPVLVRDCIIERGYRWPGAKRVSDEDPRFLDILAGDYRLRLDSPALDAGSNVALRPKWLPGGPGMDFEGDGRVQDGNLDGRLQVDIGADESTPSIAARFGTTNAQGDRLADTLFVNDSAGDRSRRIVTLSRSESIQVEMRVPPAGPAPAGFVLYAWQGEPDATTITPHPARLGLAAFPTPLRPDPLHLPLVIWNNLGHEPRLGSPTQPSQPAPSLVLDLADATLLPEMTTFQGLIEDNASGSRSRVSLTNAVVLHLTEP